VPIAVVSTGFGCRSLFFGDSELRDGDLVLRIREIGVDSAVSHGGSKVSSRIELSALLPPTTLIFASEDCCSSCFANSFGHFVNRSLF
jgi:hypothetical protein